MELRELRTFCTAARLRSISKTAEQLNIGQPTATTHIKKLERELGTLLFDRVKRPIQLTLAGAKLAQLATPLVNGIDELAAKTAKEEEDGPVSVASIHEVISHTLLSTVRAYRSKYPNVHLRIRSGASAEVLSLVRDGVVDFGVMPGGASGDEFEFQGLFGYERVLITPLGHPLLNTPLTSLEQITQWPLILMRQQTITRMVLEEELSRKGIPYDIVMELDDMDMIKRYVAMGMGVSVGPRLAIDPDDRHELGIVSLVNLLPVEQVGVLTLRGKSMSVPAQNFISVMKESVGSEAPKRRRRS